MEWTLEAFFADGGTTKFVDRVAGALGIHASTIKVVSVYEGSVIINYAITVDDDDQDKLDAIQKTQTDLYATNSISLGAPILDVTTGDNDAVTTKIVANGVVTASGYDPIVISQASAATGGSVTTFTPDIPDLQELPNSPKGKNGGGSKGRTPIIKEITATESTVAERSVAQRIENAFEGKDDTAAIIIFVTLAAFVLICVVVAIRMAINRSKKSLTEVQNIAMRREAEMKAKQGDFDAVEHTNQGLVTASGEKVIEMRDSSMALKVAQKGAKQEEVEKYEEQYDPNADFAVFGMGDPTKGGLQSLKEKMNLADAGNLDDADSSDSDAEERARRSTTQKSASPPLESPQGRESVDPAAISDQSRPKTNKLPED